MSFFAIAVHEFGHSIGLLHSEIVGSVMYAGYGGTPGADDILGARHLYKNFEPFEYGKHKYIWIQNNDERLSEDFKSSEFYTKCLSPIDSGHFLDSNLIAAVQIIRDYYDQPIVILSSYRHQSCNSRLSAAAKQSQHLKCNAIDWKFVGGDAEYIHYAYQVDILGHGCLFRTLFDAGIRGFGSYETSNHIDTRESRGNREFKGEKYSIWGQLVPGGLTDEYCNHGNN